MLLLTFILDLSALGKEFGQEVTPSGTSPTPPPPAAAELENIPEIEARTFSVSVVRLSESKRLYLFDAPVEEPKVGRILLVKRGESPVMAFRILRNYPDKKQFAAKRVHRYEGPEELSPKESFNAVEKIADLTPLVAATPQDQADLKELEAEFNEPAPPPPPPPTAAQLPVKEPRTLPKKGLTGAAEELPALDPSLDAELDGPGGVPPNGRLPSVNAYDAELDVGSSPPPDGAVDSEGAKANPSDSLINAAIEDPQEHNRIVIEETTSLDTTHHSLTGGILAIRNTPSTGGESYFVAPGLKYGFTLGHMILLRRPKLQDSLTVEAGVYLYKVLNYVNLNDAYTVMPFMVGGRYNLLFSENLGAFIYGGLLQHRVLGSSQGTDEGSAALASTFPMAGAGMLFRIGPNWDARIDFGIDSFGVGLMLRF